LLAVATDVREFKIHNALTFPLLVSGLCYQGFAGGWSALCTGTAGALCGLAVFLLPFLLGMLGAGDVKLTVAVGAWLGPQALCSTILIGCLAMMVYSTAVLLVQGRLADNWTGVRLVWHRILIFGRHLAADDEFETVQTLARSADRRQRLVPFSIMIAIGVVALFAWNLWPSKY
jgi:Flp pilus assembly protein protease CpaA